MPARPHLRTQRSGASHLGAVALGWLGFGALGLVLPRRAAALPAWSCPAGTVQRVDLLPEGGSREWCEGDGALGEGPVRERSADGALLLEGQQRAGSPVGSWRRPVPGGPPLVGPMGPDGPTGVWRAKGPDGRELRVVHHGRIQPLPGPAAEQPEGWARPEPLRPAAVADAGHLWLLSADQALRVDPGSGAVTARFGLAERLRPGAITTAEGDLVGVTQSGGLLVLRADRSLRAHSPLGYTHAAPLGPDLDPAAVLVRDGAGYLAVIDPETGARRWRSALSTAALAPAVRAEAGLALTTRDARLWALRLADGGAAWSLRLAAPALALIDLDDGDLLVVEQGGWIERVGLDGTARWRTRAPLGEGTQLAVGGGQLAIYSPSALTLVDLDAGVVGPPRAPPAGRRWAAAAASEVGLRICHRGPTAVACAPLPSLDQPWTAPLRPGDGLALLPAGLLVLPSEGGVQHVDAAIAALAQGRPEEGLSVEASGASPLVWWASPLRGPLGEALDGAFEGDLAEAALLRLRPDDGGAGCADTAGAALLPPPPPPDPALVPEDALAAALPEVELWPAPGDGPLRPAAPWEATLRAEESWRRFTLPWWPTLENVVPDDGDGALAAALDAALRCTGPGLRLRGTLFLTDGYVRRSYHGAISLRPVEGAEGEGCALWTTHDEVELGLYSSPTAPARIEGALVAEGRGPEAWAEPDEDLLPIGELDAPWRIELQLPGEGAPRTIQAPAGWWAGVDPQDVRGPSWVLRAPGVPLYSPEDGDAVLLRLPIEGIAPAQAEEPEGAATDGEADSAAGPLGRWELWAFTTPVMPTSALLWRREGCAAAPGATSPQAPVAQAALPEAAGPGPEAQTAEAAMGEEAPPARTPSRREIRAAKRADPVIMVDGVPVVPAPR
jgi:hypothetical protein